MRKTQWYVAAQVVTRSTLVPGLITEWYDQDKRATLAEAKADRKRLAAEFPGTEYAVLHFQVEEIGQSIKR